MTSSYVLFTTKSFLFNYKVKNTEVNFFRGHWKNRFTDCSLRTTGKIVKLVPSCHESAVWPQKMA